MKPPNCFLGDIQDDKFWKMFQRFDGVTFSCSTYNLMLSLNVDWFQPYKHTAHSVGVIYLVTSNLPRAIRYRIENIILVGIIPSPKEPRLSLNSYLGPMVEELQEFWYGKEVNFGKRWFYVYTTCHSIHIL